MEKDLTYQMFYVNNDLVLYKFVFGLGSFPVIDLFSLLKNILFTFVKMYINAILIKYINLRGYIMSRLTIEITGQEHQEIKAMAALQGKTLKEFVMEKIFPPHNNNSDEEEAWGELKSLLTTRIEAAESGSISQKTMQQIAKDKLTKLGAE